LTLRLNGSTSGYTEIDAPSVAGSNTLVLPTGNGTADQALVTNGSGALSFADRGRMVLSTAQNSTSGTSIDFTGIPSWVKRITIMFAGVSTNGTSTMLIQIGAGSVTTSGYLGSGAVVSDPNIVTSVVRGGGFAIDNAVNATAVRSGSAILSLMGGDNWSCFGILGRSDNAGVGLGGGYLPLGGTLDRVRITTVNGTDTFDAGTINIMMEG
jgi:hypothetical protein